MKRKALRAESECRDLKRQLHFMQEAKKKMQIATQRHLQSQQDARFVLEM
jgi:hypothetical protein